MDGRLGDVNGDGCPDAVISEQLELVLVSYGDCAGNFSVPTLGLDSAGKHGLFRLADVNGDGKLDIVTSWIIGQNMIQGAHGGQYAHGVAGRRQGKLRIASGVHREFGIFIPGAGRLQGEWIPFSDHRGRRQRYGQPVLERRQRRSGIPRRLRTHAIRYDGKWRLCKWVYRVCFRRFERGWQPGLIRGGCIQQQRGVPGRR